MFPSSMISAQFVTFLHGKQNKGGDCSQLYSSDYILLSNYVVHVLAFREPSSGIQS